MTLGLHICLPSARLHAVPCAWLMLLPTINLPPHLFHSFFFISFKTLTTFTIKDLFIYFAGGKGRWALIVYGYRASVGQDDKCFGSR